MAKYMVVLAVCVLSVHAAQFYSKDTHSRIARSPYYNGPDGPPPPPPGPPPPPVFFRTKNWSGVARSADGSTQRVFSGAAAAADSLPTSGAAYSLASSGVTGSGSCCGQSRQAGFGGQSSSNSESHGGKSIQYNGQISNGGSGFSQSNGGFSGGQQPTKSFKESHSAYESGGKQISGQGNQLSNEVNSGYSSAQSSALAGNMGGSSHSHESFDKQQLQQQKQNLNSGSQGFSDGQQQVQLESNFNENTHGKHQVGFNGQAGAAANIDATQTQKQSSDFSRSNSKSFEGSNSEVFSSSSSQAGFGASGSHQHNEAIRDNIGESKGQFNKPSPLTSSYGAGSGQIKESGSFGAGSVGGQSANGGGFSESQQSGSSSGALNSGYTSSTRGSFGAEDLQSTLGGALNLASQGLQASEQSSCNTCGKSNYALSNAKSHSGSAVALSIGG